MILWLIFALLLTATLAALLYPLVRAPKAALARADYDLAVYRAQLAEVDTDMDRGVVSPDQAEAVRLEIQRRMLEATKTGTRASADDRGARRAAAIVIAVILPVCAGLLYASRGNPDLPDRPYADRLEHDPAVILANAAAQMETQLAAKPSAHGYQRLAELYLQQHDYERAAASVKQAIQLGADDAGDWALLGQAIVLGSDGIVAPQALAAFARALELDAREPRARFYAGLAEAQIGNLKGAVAIWRDLEKNSRDDAPWLPVLRRQMATVAKLGKFDPLSVPPSAPSAAALAAAVAAMNRAMGAR
jgi:cytochrome c-type biogenesis protein CcmH